MTDAPAASILDVRTSDTDKLIDLLMKERDRDRARIAELERALRRAGYTDFCGCGKAKLPGREGCDSCLAEMAISRRLNATRAE